MLCVVIFIKIICYFPPVYLVKVTWDTFLLPEQLTFYLCVYFSSVFNMINYLLENVLKNYFSVLRKMVLLTVF